MSETREKEFECPICEEYPHLRDGCDSSLDTRAKSGEAECERLRWASRLFKFDNKIAVGGFAATIC